MRLLRRNLVPFYYKNYIGRQAIYDSSGYETGETTPSYTEAVKCMGNISVPTGLASVEAFGTEVDYDKVILLPGKTDINENSILFIEVTPGEGVSHDYIVKRVAESLNYTAIAVRRVRS